MQTHSFSIYMKQNRGKLFGTPGSAIENGQHVSLFVANKVLTLLAPGGVFFTSSPVNGSELQNGAS